MPSQSTPDFPIIPFESAVAWERWLDDNHASADGVWIQLFKKNTNKPTVTHDEAVDVALCYGWIDGQGKGHDEESHLQKFTPRRARSMWSKLNTERVERLTAAGKMKPAGLAQVEAAKVDGRWERAYAPPSETEIPADFLAELEKRPKAKAFFATLNKRNTYPIAFRLQNAKKPETRQRRMTQILDMLDRGEKFYP